MNQLEQLRTSVSPQARRFAGRFSALGPLLVFLGVFFLYPLYGILQRSVSEPELGLQNFRNFFGSEVFLSVLLNTLQMATLVTILCLLLGYPYAYLMTKVGNRWATLLGIGVLIPFWSSILVRTYAWTVILQKTGVVNQFLQSIGLIDDPLRLTRNFTGIMIGMTHVLLPLAVLPLYSAMRNIDDDLPLAGESLGASPLRAFWTIYFPLSLPGVYAAGLLVSVVALGYYITPALLGSPKDIVIGESIVQQVQSVRDQGMASAMAVVLLGVTVTLLVVVGRAVNISKILGVRGS